MNSETAALEIITQACRKQQHNILLNFSPDISILSQNGLSVDEWECVCKSLNKQRLIEIVLRPGKDIPHITLTLEGYKLYASRSQTEYEELRTKVCMEIETGKMTLNRDIATALDVDLLIVDFVFQDLKESGLISINNLNGGFKRAKLVD